MATATIQQAIEVLTNQIPTINDDHRYINHGGCGLMAKCLAEQLQGLGLSVSAVVFSSGEESEDAINTNISNNCLVNPCVHIALVLDGKHYDSTGEVTGYTSYTHVPISIETLHAILDYPMGWNPTFDRDDMPAIEHFVKDVFNIIH